METKFTSSMAFASAANKKIFAKQLFFILFLLLFSCYAITGYAQIGNKKQDKIKEDNFNGFHHFKAWLTTGNSGTNPNKNFIGTRDAQPLVFKVNNQKAGYIEFIDSIQNTSFGYQTLNSNIVSDADHGTFLSAFGWGALSANTTGAGNTAHGAGALYSNTTGGVNTGVGQFALLSNTTGEFNTAIGAFVLGSNTTGINNTASGDFALASNTTGYGNTAYGTPFTLAFNTEGSENTATGGFSMGHHITGNANSAYGVFSLEANETGSNNTALGSYADVTAVDLNNATAIGSGALVDASNKVRIGNTDVISIGGEVGWTSYSDERIKDNVRENVPGLEFIKALRPVTYHFNIAKENALLGVKNISTKKLIMPAIKGLNIPGIKGIQMPTVDIAGQNKNFIKVEDNHAIEKIQFTGFLAQDVDKAAKSIGYDFSGVDKSGKILGLRYSDFVVPLVKAVQELSKQNEDLQKQINELKATINGNAKAKVTHSNISLEQNKPNPFNQKTTIAYNIPQKFSNAQIVITDESGKMLKRITVSGNGKGTLNIDAATLSAGAYSYTLIIDGHLIETKNMVLAN